jgi:serpin B
MKLLALLLLAGAVVPAADSPIPPAMNAFTTDIYKQLAASDGNLMLSPFNIATALSMLLTGARGETAKEMESVLHVHADPNYDAALGSFLANLNTACNTGDNKLQTANGLWVQKGFAIEAAFDDTLTKAYHARLTPLDFIKDPEGARSRINSWTEEQTKEKIKDLLPPGSVDASTRLVLTSAIYFYGKWQNTFVPTSTKPAPFMLAAGGITQTDFMNQTFYTGYSETAAAQILEMNYAGTGIAFDVLLPKAGTSLADLERSLTVENLTGWLGALTHKNVQVSLPKFHLDASFSLSKTLSKMGMSSAFARQANFSGIDAHRNLVVGNVFHKAFVDVSEQGTEATAATGITIRALVARRMEPPVVFRADHPFLFLIRDTRSGVILFLGRLIKPQ